MTASDGSHAVRKSAEELIRSAADFQQNRQAASDGSHAVRKSAEELNRSAADFQQNRQVASDGSHAVRKSAEELIRCAAEAGMAQPERILHLTPREIAAAFTALESARQRRLEELDLLAWMIGRYVSIGVNTPKRFPRRPNTLKTRRPSMTDAQMRRVLINIAERSKQDGSSENSARPRRTRRDSSASIRQRFSAESPI